MDLQLLLKLSFLVIGNLVSVWLGATDEDVDSAFRWTDGYIVSWVNWDTDQPVGGPDKACIGVTGHSIKWATYECTDTRKFFCETVEDSQPISNHLEFESN